MQAVPQDHRESSEHALALLLLHGRDPQPEAVLLIHDSDGDDEWRKGLNLAREDEAQRYAFRIVVGVPHPEREAWALIGFEPLDDDENELLQSLKRELKFDPCIHPERLNPGRDDLLKGTKRALRKLIQDNRERERSCWMECDLQKLRQRGTLTGLPEYLDEVRERLVPLVLEQAGRA
jgi:hypothetical protein